ncbi:aldose epimerase family protein [Phyllobacterium chamaecytisi]|uniref:aldose epimerase family protein n=1 Tax=Phyllobacterium chamaecytisi TaxID=2876082 RepID=UPI00351CF9B2
MPELVGVVRFWGTKMTRCLDSGQSYSILSHDLRSTFSPEMGGRLLGLTYGDSIDIVVPLDPHRFDVLHWPRAGAYPLIPYHNRLADASINVDGRAIPLQAHPAAKPNTLHGPSHSRPWRVLRHETNRFAMGINYDADSDWPWHFHASQEFLVKDNVLTLRISLSNRDTKSMPAGFGWHPYFASTRPADTDAAFHWPHAHDYLPVGNRNVITEREALERQPTSYLDSWTQATIRCADGVRVTMTASAPLDYLVVHRGDIAHICVEPVTHITNAWNLDADKSSTGARFLQPGDTLAGEIKITVTL